MFSFLWPSKRESIDLASAFEQSLGRITNTEECLNQLRANPLEPGSRHLNYSNMLTLRLEMATAAEIKKRLDKGQTEIAFNKGQTLTERLLGRQASEFNIYERDIKKDRAFVMGGQ